MFHGLLLSSGFSTPSALEKVRALKEERGYTRAAVITTAHPRKEQAPWAIVTKEQLESIGLSVSFVDFDRGESLREDDDVVYVCGGNTFHLLRSIRQLRVSEQVEALCARGGLYIGSSAGAVVVSPDISSAGEVGGDRNRDGITDLRGLNLVPFHIIPHYRESTEVTAFLARHGITEDAALFLRDGEGVYVRDGRVQPLFSGTKGSG